ncbi:Uncharacterised protein [Vibrio cholerae]|nr:Uncharacterised protein [Vibrio cholerae]
MDKGRFHRSKNRTRTAYSLLAIIPLKVIKRNNRGCRKTKAASLGWRMLSRRNKGHWHNQNASSLQRSDE